MTIPGSRIISLSYSIDAYSKNFRVKLFYSCKFPPSSARKSEEAKGVCWTTELSSNCKSQCCWGLFTSHTDIFAKCKLPPGSAYRCSNINFNSQPPSLCGLPQENFLTVHPPDLHLPIVSSRHDKRHCRVEGSPVHPTIVALQAKRKVTLNNLVTEWKERRKDEATKTVDGLAKTQFSPFI